jgi:hypothetical protein
MAIVENPTRTSNVPPRPFNSPSVWPRLFHHERAFKFNRVPARRVKVRVGSDRHAVGVGVRR